MQHASKRHTSCLVSCPDNDEQRSPLSSLGASAKRQAHQLTLVGTYTMEHIYSLRLDDRVDYMSSHHSSHCLVWIGLGSVSLVLLACYIFYPAYANHNAGGGQGCTTTVLVGEKEGSNNIQGKSVQSQIICRRKTNINFVAFCIIRTHDTSDIEIL
jgi:hypothetical protein